MTRLFSLVRRYPLVLATLLVGAVAGGLQLAGAGQVAAILVSAWALGIAAWQAVGMVRDLLGGHAGVDALAIIAIAATVIVGEHWAALVIVLMLTGGEALEDYAAARAKRELTALLDRAPSVAHRVRGDGLTDDVPVHEVEVGDLIVVRPGEVVPVDGRLAQDVADFDVSQLTGEPLPLMCRKGDEVLSGSVAGERAALVSATALAQDSQYQQIVRLVAEAEGSRAPTVRLADRYAVPFTLAALAVAGLAWWMSKDPVRAAEVLVVATPCPLLIAAPVAFLGGMSRAAKSGIIVKGGGTLEVLSRIKTGAFDKTGTLTIGHPTVVAVRPAAGLDDAELLRLAAAADRDSVHVLAAALVSAADQRGLSAHASGVSEEAGNGVTASVEGRTVRVGKLSWLDPAGRAPVCELAAGQMAVHVEVDGRYAGAIVLSDRVRDNARAMLARLGELGVPHTVMLTGDGAATARSVADSLGVEQVVADCLPRDKVRAVAELPHRPVMMVGDGVNDAPVLAAADVGIAMGAKGSTASSEAADAVIMVDDVARVADAVAIGKRTVSVALQSIWLGIGISAALMAVASFGVLPAIAGAGLQEVVDLLAILGALRALSLGRGERATPDVRQPAAHPAARVTQSATR